jgi:hypothetical protein
MAKIYEGEAAEAKLDDLGLAGSAVLLDAIDAGAAAARSVTAEFPAGYRGMRLWAEATAHLRRHLPPPWKPEVSSGAELVVHHERGVGIVVTKGNEATGHAHYQPQVVYDRGESLQRLVNGSPDTLFGPGQRPDLELWFLLHHLEAEGCPAELSLPLTIDKRGQVAGWHSRVLLPTRGPGSRGGLAVAAPDRPMPEIDVPVTRRIV